MPTSASDGRRRKPMRVRERRKPVGVLVMPVMIYIKRSGAMRLAQPEPQGIEGWDE